MRYQVGRFSKSVVQDNDIMPLDAMLRAHELRSAVLPARYADKSKVANALDLLSRAFLVLRRAACLVYLSPAGVAWFHDRKDWGEEGPIARSAVV